MVVNSKGTGDDTAASLAAGNIANPGTAGASYTGLPSGIAGYGPGGAVTVGVVQELELVQVAAVALVAAAECNFFKVQNFQYF